MFKTKHVKIGGAQAKTTQGAQNAPVGTIVNMPLEKLGVSAQKAEIGRSKTARKQRRPGHMIVSLFTQGGIVRADEDQPSAGTQDPHGFGKNRPIIRHMLQHIEERDDLVSIVGKREPTGVPFEEDGCRIGRRFATRKPPPRNVDLKASELISGSVKTLLAARQEDRKSTRLNSSHLG